MRTFLLMFAFTCAPLFAAEYPDPSRWDYLVGGFALEDEIVDREPGAIVATGSSSMRYWHHRIDRDLSPLTVIHRGFGGSNMNDVLHHMDTLVLALGHQAHDPLSEALLARDLEVHLVGDCASPRTAEEAVFEGLLAGTRI